VIFIPYQTSNVQRDLGHHQGKRHGMLTIIQYGACPHIDKINCASRLAINFVCHTEILFGLIIYRTITTIIQPHSPSPQNTKSPGRKIEGKRK
jgi:hypothetical protein